MKKFDPNCPDRPIRTMLAPRLAAFDLDGNLVEDARAIGQLIVDHEDAAIDAFWDRYISVAPVDFRPNPPELNKFRQQTHRVLRVFFGNLADQNWADEVHLYWLLTSGDKDAIASVRAAKVRQYDVFFECVFEATCFDLARCRHLLGALARISALENCILAQSLGEGNRRRREEDLARYAQVFRDQIASGVKQASEMGVEVRSRSSDAANATRGMLVQASEVVDAAERSAEAMRSASSTAAGLVRGMDKAREEVGVAARDAARASDQLEEAVRVSETLSETAKSIESIVQVIRDVAGQTDLLALNAAIEAARAGDAGRGFAVVAQEVKSLATQTANATDDITAKVTAMQAATRLSLEANDAIGETVADVKRSATQVRNAVEDQAQTVTVIIATVDDTALAADAMSVTLARIRDQAEDVANEIDTLDGGFERVNGKLSELQSAANDYVNLVS